MSTLGIILIIILILALFGGFHQGWGYGMNGGIGLVLLVVIILLVMGKI